MLSNSCRFCVLTMRKYSNNYIMRLCVDGFDKERFLQDTCRLGKTFEGDLCIKT